MSNVSGIHSMTDFQREACNHLQKRLKDTRRPMTLAVNGKPEVGGQDAPKHSGDQKSGKPKNPKKHTNFFFLLPLRGASHGSEVSP